jgi:replicative DNA helicase
MEERINIGESSELGLIGCILNGEYPILKALGEVSDVLFSNTIPQTIWSVLKGLNEVPSIPILEVELSKKGVNLSAIQIREIKENSKGIDYKELIPIVIERYRKRIAVDQLSKATREMDDPNADARTVVNKLLVVIDKINKVDDFETVKEDEIYETLWEIIELSKGTTVPMMSTGHSGLDKLLSGGFEYPSLNIIGARSRVGKTALSMWMLHKAVNNGEICGFIGTEMSRKQLNRRELAMISGIQYSWMKNPKGLSEMQLKGIANAADVWKMKHFHRVYCAYPDIDQLRAQVSYLVHKFGCKFIVIDYLQRLNFNLKGQMSSAWAVSQMASQIKSIAIQFNVGIILLSQLNRSNEKEAKIPRPPKLTDLKESGGIEEAADTILLLHRYDIYEDAPKDSMGNNLSNQMLVNVGKNRDGEADAEVLIKCNMSINMFYEDFEEPLWQKSFYETKQAYEPPF